LRFFGLGNKEETKKEIVENKVSNKKLLKR